MAERFLEWAAKQHPPPPTFVFVDPFGISGVSLDLLRRLMKIERLEVFLTLMVRDPARFLEEENYAAPLTELFGGETWKECMGAENKPQCLMFKFRNLVLDRVAEYDLLYRIFEDKRHTALLSRAPHEHRSRDARNEEVDEKAHRRDKLLSGYGSAARPA